MSYAEDTRGREQRKPPAKVDRSIEGSTRPLNAGAYVLSADDVPLTRELVQFAIESLGDVINIAELNARFAGGKPIVRQIERYRDDARALLARLQGS